MTWFNDITQLQYYNQPKGLPCYCEVLIFPSDLILQGFFAPSGGNYSIALVVYSADGVTALEDITSYMSIYYAHEPTTNQDFFNARLNSWPDSICEHKCFIIKATVTATTDLFTQEVFRKYTERYCQSECCDEARDIVIEQDGFEVTGTTSTIPTQNARPYTECGYPLIRLISNHNCYDPIANIFFGIPGNVISGVADYPFVKISTFKGRIVRRPQDIKREQSYNCRLQRVTTTPQYLLEGFEYFPTWKMLEINAQFGAKEIYVDDYYTNKQYQFGGGVPLQQVSKCFELFKLNTVVQDCELRKVYGCDTPCETPSLYSGYQSFFIVPADYNGEGFFNDSKVKVADDTATLIEYLRNLNGMTSAGEVGLSPVPDCDFYTVVGFSGNGYLPNSIYYNSTTPANRIFSVGFTEASEICGFITNTCPMPVAGAYTIFGTTCPIPVAGSITYTEASADDIGIQEHLPWEFIYAGSPLVPQGVHASLYNNQVTLSLEVHNYSVIPTPGDEFAFTDEVIGVIYAEGRPLVTIFIDSSNNNLPEGWVISIDQYGVIRFSGTALNNIGSDVEVSFTDIVYNI